MSKSICTDCSHKLRCDMADLRGGDTAITKCYGFAKDKYTKADRIRAFTDEDLATWVETFAGCDLCPMLDEQCSGGEVNSRASCKRHWLEWLRQETKEDK